MYAKLDKELEDRYVMTEFPLNIGIEVTNNCNLNCIMCNNDKLTRPRGFMSIQLYKKIIDEVAKKQPGTRIWLDFYGEALLAGFKVYYMIDYAKKAGLTNICINTNGTVMKPEYAEMLIDAGTDYISIDCDGFSKEVYESIRKGANRDAFYRNVEYLLEYKKKMNSKTVIDVKVMEFEQNKDEIKQILDYWRARGAWTAVRRVSKWVDDKAVDKDTTMSEEERIACGHGFGTMVVSWDGKVGGCAWDYDLAMCCGDISWGGSIEDIWKERNERFLRLHKEHRWEELPGFCRYCENWKNIGEIRFDENGNNVDRNYKIDEKIF